MKKVMIAVATATFMGAAFATNYYLKDDATDWSAAASFTLDEEGTQPASTTPGSSDAVYLTKGKACAFTLPTDEASFNVFANVDQVIPVYRGGCTIEITIPENQTNTLNCALAYAKDSVTYASLVVTKKGLGGLQLASNRKVTGSTGYDYLSSFVIEAGDLICVAEPNCVPTFMGAVNVAVGAKFVLPSSCANANYHNSGLRLCGGLHGGGQVVNTAQTEVDLVLGKGLGYLSWEEDAFSGKLDGFVYVIANGANFTGEESTFTGTAKANYDDSATEETAAESAFKIKKFGMNGEASSAGSGTIIGAGNNGGYLLYTGAGNEECDKIFEFDCCYNADMPPSTVDAGVNGGVRFTGSSWRGKSTYSGGKFYMNRLVLTGANTQPCVIDAPINSWRFSSAYDRFMSFHILKRGSGTWELSGNAKNSTNAGAITVEEGTLRYDSLAEIGTKCSLGTATNLREFVTASYDTIPLIPYAMVLGGANTSGRLEYVGTERFDNTTRKIGLVGKGGTLASVATNVIFEAGVTSKETGNHTLVLDNARDDSGDIIHDITDGVGKVSVTKTGAGEWTMDGTLDFSGDLTVAGGKLTIEAPDAPYKWIRFVVKCAYGTNNTEGTHFDFVPRLYEFALYDANGIRQNVGLACNRDIEWTSGTAYFDNLDSHGDVLPGYYTIGKWRERCQGSKTAPYTSSDRSVKALFSDTGSASGLHQQGWVWNYLNKTGYVRMPKKDEEDTWVNITMRLTNSTPEIVAYDMEGYMGNAGKNENAVSDWAIAVSRDGKSWNTIENKSLTDEQVAALQSGYWYSNPSKVFKSGAVRKGEGFPMAGHDATAGGLTMNVSGVYVAPGAELKAEGSVTLPALTLNPSGMGTLDGFKFANSGTLNITGVVGSGPSSVTLPTSFVNCTGADNIVGWNVTVNGTPKRNWTLSRREDGSFVANSIGLIILMR